MKNNRSITLENDFLSTHQLPKTPPPADSLFWKMWNTCKNIAQDTLHTDFIQGIKAGTLNPVKYGGFNVSDAYYCFKGAQDYLAAANRASHPTLSAFLLKKHHSYQSYNQTFPTIWHVKDADGIVPTEVCTQYAAFESQIATNEDPIYTLITMLPCEYLWAWLGSELSPPTDGNLYADWITGNDYPDGAYTMGNFIEIYRQQYPIDEGKSLKLYKQAMTYEYENFKVATA